MDGIAHSQLVLADVSTVWRDSKTSYRNGNVMYEVGLALASRHSSEVLLVRDDGDKFLFDVSTIPHTTINFGNVAAARQTLEEELRRRLEEQEYLRDARVQLATAQLSSVEAEVLAKVYRLPPDTRWGLQHWRNRGVHELCVARLVDKGVVRVVGRFESGNAAYSLTSLGRVVAQQIQGLPHVEDTVKEKFD